MVLQPRALAVGVGLLAVLAIGLASPWLSLRGLDGRLEFDRDRAREGDELTVRLTLANRLPWGVLGLVVDPGLCDGSPPYGVATAPGRATTSACWRVIVGRRGVYPKGSPRVATGFPFGIREATRALSAPRPLVVWPKTYPVGLTPEAAGCVGATGTPSRNRAGGSGELMGVRPYRRGDPLRRIHWAQTARHDRLIVCELQAQADPSVQVVLDASDQSHPCGGDDGSFEWAVRVAASLVDAWIDQGRNVELVYADVTIGSGRVAAARRRAAALDALATLAPGDSPALSEVLAGTACRKFRGLRVVVTTDVGLDRLGPWATRKGADRFVVLKASGFGAGTGDIPLTCSPWLRIDDPRGVPHALLGFRKGGARGA